MNKIIYRDPNITIFQSTLFQTNSTVVKTEDSILVVDPAWLPHEVANIRREVDEIRGNRPVFLIFTHSDYDHIIGYKAFQADKVFMSKALADNPGKKLIPQVTVTTRSGRRRRPDYVLAHPNGSVRPVEVKNVPELTEGHVRQAEDHRDGLQSMGLRSGRPIVVVPASTVVREEHANRVEVVKIRKRARR